MSAREKGKLQRREAILRAAKILMSKDGGEQFSMRTLAEMAGVSIATPYNLFGSKQAIFIALLDSDLERYKTALSELRADKIEVLFRALTLMSSLLSREAAFYRNVFAAVVREGGPEFRILVHGPRYALWKNLLRQATEASLLEADVDPDAFAIALSQLILAIVQDWAQGSLGLEEMNARLHYGLALTLSAIATDQSRGQLRKKMRSAEAALQKIWRTALAERLRKGDIDPESAEILADQLKHLKSSLEKETI